MDHGSSDSTPEVARTFGEKIRYVRRELDSGPEFAWMDGLLRVDTPFAKILHDDDWLSPDFLSECLMKMTADVGFVVSNASIVAEDGKYIRPALEVEFSELLKTGSRQANRKMSRALFSPSQMLFRTEDLLDGMFLRRLPFQEHNYFGAGSDHYMKLLAMTRYKSWAYVSEKMASFRAHSGSITVNATKDDADELELNLTYRDVHDFYRMLRILQFFRTKSFFNMGHLLRENFENGINFLMLLITQVKKHGLVPLRFQNKR